MINRVKVLGLELNLKPYEIKVHGSYRTLEFTFSMNGKGIYGEKYLNNDLNNLVVIDHKYLNAIHKVVVEAVMKEEKTTLEAISIAMTKILNDGLRFDGKAEIMFGD